MGAGRLKASMSTRNRERPLRMQGATPSSSSRPGSPSCFLCPIHLDVMADPVILHTGITYDRVSIETWLTADHKTCPVTNQPLLHHELIPNHTLRRAILTWCTESPWPIPIQPVKLCELTTLLDSVTTNESSLQSLVAVLPKLEEGQKRALFGDPKNFRSTLAASLSSLISSERSSYKTKGNAAEILHCVCEVDPAHVGAHPDAIKGLTKLLSEACKIPEYLSVSAGLKGLFSLCRWNKKNRVVAIECHTVSVLMEVINHETGNRRSSVELCCGILDSLANCAEGREAIRNHPVGVARVVESLLGVSDVTTEYAVGALWGVLALAADRRSVMHAAMRAGVFQMLLMVMSSDCSPRAKSQAREMLKMLNDECGCGSCYGDGNNPKSSYGGSPAADAGSLRRRLQATKRSPKHWSQL